LILGLRDFPISEAPDEVIVHHSHCLHVGVNDGGTYEAESTAFQVFAKRIGFRRGRGNLLHNFPAVQFGLTTDKAPRIRIKTSELLLNCEKRPCVAYGRVDLLPVPNDSWIKYQLLNLFLAIPRDFIRIELAESAAIAFTLVQDRRPTQSGLRPLQN